MDKQYKHLNGEERGVILAEHRRGASLGAIERCWGAAPRPSGENWAGAVRWQTPLSRIARSLARTGTGRFASGADGGANWLRVAGCMALCGAS